MLIWNNWRALYLSHVQEIRSIPARFYSEKKFWKALVFIF